MPDALQHTYATQVLAMGVCTAYEAKSCVILYRHPTLVHKSLPGPNSPTSLKPNTSTEHLQSLQLVHAFEVVLYSLKGPLQLSRLSTLRASKLLNEGRAPADLLTVNLAAAHEKVTPS